MAGTYLERPPIMLLADALALSELAADYPVSWQDSHATLSRSAILTAIVALEATANTLISSIRFPERLLGIIDQAPVTEKFEFALYARNPERTLDRGVRHTQVLRELVEVRNRFVHPKATEHRISHRNLGGETFQIEKATPPTRILRLPASAEDWRATHVRAVIKAVFEFLDYFLIDLCEWPPDALAAILLSRVTIDGETKSIRPQTQARLFLRAARHGLRSHAIWNALNLGERELQKPTRFKIKYSWTRGPMQVLDQTQRFDIHNAPRLYDAMTAAVQQFFNWFASAEYHLKGRDLAEFEVVTDPEGERLAHYRSLIPVGKDQPAPEALRHVGTVAGAKAHFFANGFSAVELSEQGAVITLVEASGRGRTITIVPSAIGDFLHLAWLNARPGWCKADPLSVPEVVETKGRDFVAKQIEIVAYDPSSETMLVTYVAESGTVVQINMPPSTLVALYSALVEWAS